MRAADRDNYKQRLVDMRDRLLGEVTHMIDSMPEKAQLGGELSHLPTHNADHDSEGLDNELLLIRNEENILADVEKALGRIEEGSYGVCESCGTEIPPARLDALPFTSRCVSCADQPAADE